MGVNKYLCPSELCRHVAAGRVQRTHELQQNLTHQHRADYMTNDDEYVQKLIYLFWQEARYTSAEARALLFWQFK